MIPAKIEVNLDGLAKFAETICNATGWSAKGYKKMADAKIYERIENAKADTAIEIEKLQGQDIVEKYKEIRNRQKFENALNIVQKAEQQFNEGEQVSNEPVDKDWLNRFLDYAEGVSEEEMQNIWAKILAGEVKQPKSFSLRTLDVLRNMTKEEAELFAEVSNNVFGDIFIFRDDNSKDITKFFQLCDSGLLLLEGVNNSFQIEPNNVIVVKMFGKCYVMFHNSSDEHISIHIPVYKLSKAGIELNRLLESETSDEIICKISKVGYSCGASLVNQVECTPDESGKLKTKWVKSLDS